MEESRIVNIAIMASGEGTNTENIIKYFVVEEFNKKYVVNNQINYNTSEQDNILPRIACVISNKEDAKVLTRAQKYKIPTYYTKFYKEIDQILTQHQIHYIVLAGYLDKLPPNFVQKYQWKIINIHPALLPKHGGKGMYGDRVHQAVKKSGDTKSGISIHFVDKDYDTGTVFFQKEVRVYPEDTWEDIKASVRELERIYYPVVIEKLIRGTYDHLFKSF